MTQYTHVALWTWLFDNAEDWSLASVRYTICKFKAHRKLGDHVCLCDRMQIQASWRIYAWAKNGVDLQPGTQVQRDTLIAHSEIIFKDNYIFYLDNGYVEFE